MNVYRTLALVANAAIHDYEQTAALIKEYPSVIAVDGGLYHCDKMGILPDLLIGDIDSVSASLLEKYPHLPIKRFPTEKNETDLELALQSFFYLEVEKITIFAALEKRVDHLVSNLQLLRRYPGKVFLENEEEIIFAIANAADVCCRRGQTISFMSLSDISSGIFSEGLKWELFNASFDKYFYSLSNICLKERIKIRLEHGDLLCCLLK